ncbi:GH32 C-terminal domain-containing protein [uncultured Corynebacterium sp.]|uniref:GH32 C-terminal domain-containing protein n=1 Tax=uncultured Corynebacterium sp. TaxID=159447 RepID=UPI0025F84C73|nr:GH32 C-terminal domain-containing protein [uncultured Corynebacterium sp.]
MTHRPELHLLPESGILYGPAGVLLDGTTWHVFYQYAPAADAPSRWGHSFAEDDPFYWLECDDALAAEGSETSLRAGSVTAAPDGGARLYFTSVCGEDASVGLARCATINQTCDISDEPNTLDSTVERVGTVVAAQHGFERFRSPCVVPAWANAADGASEDRTVEHEGWLMLALTGSAEHPVPVVLRSADGLDWQFTGPLTFAGEPDFPTSDGALPPVVAPRIVRLRDEVSGDIRDILFVTIEAPTGEISGYLVGTLHGAEFQVTTGFRRLDYGHDFTRPRNTNVTPGTPYRGEGYAEALIIGLLNGRGRADTPLNHHSWAEEGWANVLTLPRHVTLQDGVLYQTPPRHLPRAVEDSDHARLWSGLLTIPEGSSLTVTLLDGAGEPAATVTHSGAELTIDRSLTRAFGHTYRDDAPAVAPLAEGDEDSLTVVVDGSTIEVYADSGLVAMSSRMYFEGGCSGFRVETTGDAEIQNAFEVPGS